MMAVSSGKQGNMVRDQSQCKFNEQPVVCLDIVWLAMITLSARWRFAKSDRGCWLYGIGAKACSSTAVCAHGMILEGEIGAVARIIDFVFVIRWCREMVI